MVDTMPDNPYRCVNCNALCEKPHTYCPECRQVGTIIVREGLDTLSSDGSEERDGEGQLYRCIDCGKIVAKPYRECPRCGGTFLARYDGTKPASDAALSMFDRGQ